MSIVKKSKLNFISLQLDHQGLRLADWMFVPSLFMNLKTGLRLTGLNLKKNVLIDIKIG